MGLSKHALKNRLKKALRRTFATLNSAGLGLLLRKLGCAQGAGIVMTHCVGHVPETGYLPPDMKTSVAKVEKLLKALARRGVRCTTVRDVVAALDRGEKAQDLLAFTMDDGYRDNLTEALPLLRRHGATGTVFVETHVVGTRQVSWMHRYFFVVWKRGEEFFAREYVARCGEPEVREKLSAALAGGGSDLGALYDLKRVLKYEADPGDRERVTREILALVGTRDEEIARSYLDWTEVEALARGGVEIGAHTVHHEILSRLDLEGVRREIGESTHALRERLGQDIESFAYPFGRRWDYNDDCFDVLKDLGYRSACAALDGTNDPGTDRLQLRRLPLNDDIPLSEVLAEIDGTFPLVRRLFRIRI